MPPTPSSSEGSSQAKTISEFDARAAAMAGQAVSEDPPLVPAQEGDSPTVPIVGSLEAFQARIKATFTRIGSLITERLVQEDKSTSDTEDPHISLGGGIGTFNEWGYVPRIGDFNVTNTRGRNGKPVTRVELNGKFVDVHLNENPSPGRHNNQAIEDAKETLRHGGGRSVEVLRRTSH